MKIKGDLRSVEEEQEQHRAKAKAEASLARLKTLSWTFELSVGEPDRCIE